MTDKKRSPAPGATGSEAQDMCSEVHSSRCPTFPPDEFHETRDFNGEPRRVKRYWLDRDAMQALFERQPEFKPRCMLFSESFKQGGRGNE